MMPGSGTAVPGPVMWGTGTREGAGRDRCSAPEEQR